MADFPVYLKLLLGATKLSPAPKELMEALVQAEVKQTDRGPSGFQLIFESRLDGSKDDYPLINHASLKSFTRAALVAIVGGKSVVLIDGYITNAELDPISGRITVTGEDISIKMDLIQMQVEYKNMKVSAIVNTILGAYAGLGLTKQVTKPKNEVAPVDNTPTQRDTDRKYLTLLAQENDSLFYVRPGKSIGKNIAYWGPPLRKGGLQREISARNGAVFGNIEELSVSNDALKTELTYGEKMVDGDGGKEGKEAKFAATKYEDVALAKIPPALGKFAGLATDPVKARAQATKLAVKGKYINQMGLDPATADITAQSRTDRSTGDSVTLTGTIDTVNYGAVLKAPGLVGVRAAGASVSGAYYVREVKHSFQLRRPQMRYTQSFTLVREGLGAKKKTVR